MWSRQPPVRVRYREGCISIIQDAFQLNVLLGKIIHSQTLCTRLGPCENINNVYLALLGPEATFYFEDKLKAENSSRNWRKLSLGHFHGNIMDVLLPVLPVTGREGIFSPDLPGQCSHFHCHVVFLVSIIFIFLN